MITYSSITNRQGVGFLHQQKANKEQIAINEADFWCGAIYKNNVIAVIGLDHTKNTARIKNFYVDEKHRNKGVGMKLLNHIMFEDEVTKHVIESKDKVTTYATELSKPLFKKVGFKEKHTNKNNVTFMERKKKL